MIDIRKIDRVRPVCNVESRCSVHRSCRRRVRFKQPYRSSPCGNRPCGRPAQQENEFSPLQFLELHLLAMVSQRGRLQQPGDPSQFLHPTHPATTTSAAFWGILHQRHRAAPEPRCQRTQEQDRSVYRLSTITRTNSEPLCLAKAALFAKAREAARFPGGLGTCSSSTLGGDFSGDHFYA